MIAESSIEKVVCRLMLRAGMSRQEAEGLVRELLAGVPCDAQQKLEGRESED